MEIEVIVRGPAKSGKTRLCLRLEKAILKYLNRDCLVGESPRIIIFEITPPKSESGPSPLRKSARAGAAMFGRGGVGGWSPDGDFSAPEVLQRKYGVCRGASPAPHRKAGPSKGAQS